MVSYDYLLYVNGVSICFDRITRYEDCSKIFLEKDFLSRGEYCPCAIIDLSYTKIKYKRTDVINEKYRCICFEVEHTVI